jgi:DNA-binding MarR family transcriptional regulator
MASIGPDQAARLADFAHAVLSVARDIRLYGHFDPEIVDMTALESLVMSHIQRSPGISPSRICDEMGLRSSNASAVLRSLEAKGLIRRAPDRTDRRLISVHPTPLAARNLANVRAEWAQLLAGHVDDTAGLVTAIEVLNAADESFTRRADSVRARSVDPMTQGASCGDCGSDQASADAATITD